MTTAGAVAQRIAIPTPNADPLALVATRRGGLLIAQHYPRVVSRLSPYGVFRRDIRLRSHPDSLTLGPDGDLWYAAGDEGRIGRISR
jgi:hypothetical protein